MSSEAFLIREYYFSSKDTLLVDANVWLYLYGPQEPKDWRPRAYSQALKWILKAGSTMFVDVLVLSEFVNRYSRLEFGLWKQTSGIDEFKAYRKHPDFRPVGAAIAAAVRRIIKQARCIETGLESMDMQLFLNDYEVKCPDFNDQVIVELCRGNGLKLLTHDVDFKECGIPVITANRRLLA
ncbi:MAG: PIN domain-containing protein [Deltaproteobacteria bacterium]